MLIPDPVFFSHYSSKGSKKNLDFFSTMKKINLYASSYNQKIQAKKTKTKTIAKYWVLKGGWEILSAVRSYKMSCPFPPCATGGGRLSLWRRISSYGRGKNIFLWKEKHTDARNLSFFF